MEYLDISKECVEGWCQESFFQEDEMGRKMLCLGLFAALVLVIAMCLISTDGEGLSVTAQEATTTPSFYVYLPLASDFFEYHGPIGRGWVQFGSEGAPLYFNWSSEGVITKPCAGIPAGLIYYDAFAVFPLSNGDWIVYSQSDGSFPDVESPNLLAWRCQDAKTVVLGSRITDQGASLFNTYGQSRLIVSRWDERTFTVTGHLTLMGNIVADGDGVRFADVRPISSRKIDDVRGNRYIAYEMGRRTCYESGTIVPFHKEWELCVPYPTGQSGRVNQDVVQGAADFGRENAGISPSGRYAFINWMPITPTQHYSAWACSIWDTTTNKEVVRINSQYDALNPCRGDNDWMMTANGHEEWWYQAFYPAEMRGLNIYDATVARWTKKGYFPLDESIGMVLSADGTRMYGNWGPGGILVAHDTSVLQHEWQVMLSPLTSMSAVLPTH